MRRLLIILTLYLGLNQVSCVSIPPPLDQSQRAELGNMGIIVAQFPPDSNIQRFSDDCAKAAGEGAAAGAAIGTAIALGMAVTNPLGVILFPYIAAISVPAGAVVGGVARSGAAVPIEQVEGEIQHQLDELGVQERFAEVVNARASADLGRHFLRLSGIGPSRFDSPVDYRGPEFRGVTSVMELAVKEIGFERPGALGRRLAFFMIVRARLIVLADSRIIFEREFAYRGMEREPERWVADQVALLAKEFENAYEELADSVVQAVFLIADLRGASVVSTCGLPPVSPPRQFHPAMHRAPFFWNEFPLVSLEPTLQWEPFPGEVNDGAKNEHLLHAVENIRYDLRVWRIDADYARYLVYSREGLREPAHHLETPLEPDSRYFWSVRARFENSGAPHATMWSRFRTPYYIIANPTGAVKPLFGSASVLGLLIPYAPFSRDPCALDFIPVANYYRFETSE